MCFHLFLSILHNVWGLLHSPTTATNNNPSFFVFAVRANTVRQGLTFQSIFALSAALIQTFGFLENGLLWETNTVSNHTSFGTVSIYPSQTFKKTPSCLPAGNTDYQIADYRALQARNPTV